MYTIMILEVRIKKLLTKAEGQAIKYPAAKASPIVLHSHTSLTNSSLSIIVSFMCTSTNSAPNSIPAALVAGLVLRIVAYATFRLFGYVEVFRTTLEPSCIMINIRIQ